MRDSPKIKNEYKHTNYEQLRLMLKKKSFKLQQLLFFIMLSFYLSCSIAKSEDRIRNIIIKRNEVFEPIDKDWFFGSSFLNSLHAVTKEYIIEDELLFSTGDIIEEETFQETERNLHLTGLFTTERIELEEVSKGLFDVYVETKDRWSLYPGILIGANGGEYVLGARLKEYNLLGHGIVLNIDGAYIYRSDTAGYHWNVELEKKRLFRTELCLSTKFNKKYLYNNQEIAIEKPFRTLNTKSSYGFSASNWQGNSYFSNKYKNILFDEVRLKQAGILEVFDTLSFVKLDEQKANLWYARSWLSDDRVYISALLEWQQAKHTNKIFQKAYDNQSKLLIGFSSIAHTFYAIKNVNSYSYENLAVGGWGHVILGAIFPSNKDGEKNMFYVGAQAEKSYYSHRTYLFAQLSASSSFGSNFAKYTYQEFLGLAYFRLTDELTIAARIKEQTVWNYPRMRQLILDDMHGVRGYTLQSIAGDNRFIANLELRYFPEFRISVMQFSGVAFFDIGSVWNQKVENAFLNARFYSSIGLGIRGHFTKSDNPDHTFRIDIPYNFYTKNVGISLGYYQYFSAVKNHIFRLPTIYGDEFNNE